MVAIGAFALKTSPPALVALAEFCDNTAILFVTANDRAITTVIGTDSFFCVTTHIVIRLRSKGSI